MVEEIQIQEPRVERREETVERRNTERALKIFAPILVVISILALIWLKYVNPKFPLYLVFIIGAVVLLIGLLMFFGFTLYRKFQEKPDAEKEYRGRLPKPASLAELRKMASECLTDEHFCNHTTGCKNERYVHSGKFNERIYIYHTHALYDTEMEKGEVYVIINSHFPFDLRTVLIDPSATEKTQAIHALASEREELPDEEVESRRTYNPITTAYEEVEKRHTKKEELKKEEKEDLK